jgi:hypothetical protein
MHLEKSNLVMIDKLMKLEISELSKCWFHLNYVVFFLDSLSTTKTSVQFTAPFSTDQLWCVIESVQPDRYQLKFHGNELPFLKHGRRLRSDGSAR